MWYSDLLYFFRKPAGLATTRGKERSFLDSFATPELKIAGSIDDFPHMVDVFQQMSMIHGVNKDNEAQTKAELGEMFSRDEEYGLLNRLDTATSGLLYFARSREVYEQYRVWQHAGLVKKWYFAEVWGDVGRNVKKNDDGQLIIDGKTIDFVQSYDDGFVLRFPMMHHRHDPERMVSCQTDASQETFTRRGRGHILTPETFVSVISYDPEKNTSIVRVMIHQGVRHQIRAHLATLGNPILGDILYGEGDGLLQLISAGCAITQ